MDVVDPLLSTRAKLRWAHDHRDTLYDQLEAAIDPDIHPITWDTTLEPDSDDSARRRAVVRIASTPKFTAEHSLLLGDVIHALRSALDHLAWAVVQKHGRRDLSEDEERMVGFPTSLTRKGFAKKVKTAMPDVGDQFVSLTEKYQPYQPTDEALMIERLAELDNTDKHRFIIPTIAPVAAFQLDVEYHDCQPVGRVRWLVGPMTEPGFRPLSVDMPVLEVAVVTKGDQPDVRLVGRMSTAPVLEALGVNVFAQLDEFASVCDEIVTEFARHL
jgi:hypothetical protein